ncbi:hypothetical protein QBC38DRAFT_541574 [Podospora fimiseda]|uniref:DNA/RNA-binding domain-containing protein n=1 Tax=Podospora fimiseda TaxID=252190 RepID=A0AAN7BXV3_9PEZI|nr:hypothetical protein QBC38DRAFT_541574 [Podospora fimiseda]
MQQLKVSPRNKGSLDSRPQSAIHNKEKENIKIEMMRQLETRAITQEQLIAEMKGIYAGLVLVESKCIEVDNQLTTNKQTLNQDQWMALVALHRQLLYEHHDFFMANRLCASPAVRQLPLKYAMLARFWRHGIHTFLELLRHNLPQSLEHMLNFIYTAYTTIAILSETVPAFVDIWMECLGDLARFRMAIENDDISVRTTWALTLPPPCYPCEAQGSSTAIFYNKALTVSIPFRPTCDSIMTLFEPIMKANANLETRPPPFEHIFIKAHGIMFSNKNLEQLPKTIYDVIGSLNAHIGRRAHGFLEESIYIGISNCCALTGYGDVANPIYSAIKPPATGEQQEDQPMASRTINKAASETLTRALDLSNKIHDVMLRRYGDSNILPYVHTTIIFMNYLTHYPDAMAYLARKFPWKLLSLFLNTLDIPEQSYSCIESESFPLPIKDNLERPLPEDYAMRSLLWADEYYPSHWFLGKETDYEEWDSMGTERTIRILFLARRIARDGQWLKYDSVTRRFSVTPEFDIDITSQMEGIEYGDGPGEQGVGTRTEVA